MKDAAEMYPVPPRPETAGRTEIALGKWLKTVPRHNVVVATKVCTWDMPIYCKLNHTPAGSRVRVRRETHSSSPH